MDTAAYKVWLKDLENEDDALTCETHRSTAAVEIWMANRAGNHDWPAGQARTVVVKKYSGKVTEYAVGVMPKILGKTVLEDDGASADSNESFVNFEEDADDVTMEL